MLDLGLNLTSSNEALEWGNTSKLPQRIIKTLEDHKSKVLDVKRPSSRNISDMCEDLQRVTLDEVGLNIRFDYSPIGVDAYTAMVNPTDPRLSEELATFIGKDISKMRELDLIKTTVCNSTGKVSGPLTELPYYVFFTGGWVNELDLTASELAAILLHEIGHNYAMFEHVSVAYTSGLVVQHFIDQYTGTDTASKRVTILQDLKLGNSKDEIETVVESDIKTGTSAAAQAILIARQTELIERDFLGRRGQYSGRTMEQQADDFVMRMGMGDHMASAIAKTAGGTLYGRGKYAAAAAYGSLGVVMTILTMGLNPVVILSSIVFDTIMMLAYLDAARAEVGKQHDPLPVRLQRMLNTQIAAIRDGGGSAEDKSRRLIMYGKMIKDIERLRKDTGMGANEEYFIRHLLPNIRSANKFSEAMYQLETITNNKLHVIDARLGGLSR